MEKTVHQQEMRIQRRQCILLGKRAMERRRRLELGLQRIGEIGVFPGFHAPRGNAGCGERVHGGAPARLEPSKPRARKIGAVAGEILLEQNRAGNPV